AEIVPRAPDRCKNFTALFLLLHNSQALRTEYRGRPAEEARGTTLTIQGGSMLSFGKKKSARAGLRAALLAGATVGAFALVGLGAAGTASASLNCGGSAITGAGSSLQKVAQQNVWTPGFNGATGVCPSGPGIAYEPVGSGAGMANWNH